VKKACSVSLVSGFLTFSFVLLALPCRQGSLLPGPAGAFAEEAKTKKDTPAKKKTDAKSKKKAVSSKKSTADLDAWGTIKEVKGTDFWEFSYVKLDGKKRVKRTAFIKVESDVAMLEDKLIQVSELKESDKVLMWGRIVERETPDMGGVVGGMDRQIQNVAVIATGDGVEVKGTFKDPRDPDMQWLEAEISKPGQALWASCDGAEYRVVMVRTVQAFKRDAAAESRKLKSGMYLQVEGSKSEERPDTKKAADAKKDSFNVKSLVILDSRLTKMAYPMLLD
jgi:hypothetical protein